MEENEEEDAEEEDAEEEDEEDFVSHCILDLRPPLPPRQKKSRPATTTM